MAPKNTAFLSSNSNFDQCRTTVKLYSLKTIHVCSCSLFCDFPLFGQLWNFRNTNISYVYTVKSFKVERFMYTEDLEKKIIAMFAIDSTYLSMVETNNSTCFTELIKEKLQLHYGSFIVTSCLMVAGHMVNLKFT